MFVLVFGTSNISTLGHVFFLDVQIGQRVDEETLGAYDFAFLTHLEQTFHDSLTATTLSFADI